MSEPSRGRVGRDLARGMYGSIVPVRPAERPSWIGSSNPRVCLRGHDLAIGGATRPYSHLYRQRCVRCTVCEQLRDSRAEWALLWPGEQHRPDELTAGLALVAHPPAVRGGLGRIEIRLANSACGDVDLRACGPCRRAVIEHIRVNEDSRRLGYGRMLIAAALHRAPPDQYRWSTTTVADDPISHAFWAGISWPGTLGDPDYCTDMRDAAGIEP